MQEYIYFIKYNSGGVTGCDINQGLGYHVAIFKLLFYNNSMTVLMCHPWIFNPSPHKKKIKNLGFL